MNGARTVVLNGVAMFAGFSADGKTRFVPTRDDHRLVAIDTATLTTRPLPLPAQACLNAHAFVMGKDGVVVCEGDHVTRPGSIVWINSAAFAIIGFVEVGMFSDVATWLPAL